MKNKAFICGICAALFALSLPVAGCADSAEQGNNAGNNTANISGEAVNAGTVTAVCPDGWTSVGAPDITSDDPAAQAANELRFVKGGSSEADLLTNAYLDIICHGPNSNIMQTDPSEWYDNVAEISGFTTGNYTWAGYSAQSLGVPFVYVSSELNGYTLEVYLYTREGTENAAAITDADVLAVLESITF